MVSNTLDADRDYKQCEVEWSDQDKAKFNIHMGLFHYVLMPFSHKNVPFMFQRALNINLSRFKWQFALFYLDNAIIYSRSVKEQFGHVQTVLDLLRSAGITLCQKKGFFPLVSPLSGPRAPRG